MKRLLNRSKGQISFMGWVQYVSMVLVFIGLWQLLVRVVTYGN